MQLINSYRQTIQINVKAERLKALRNKRNNFVVENGVVSLKKKIRLTIIFYANYEQVLSGCSGRPITVK